MSSASGGKYDLRPPAACDDHIAAFDISPTVQWCPNCGAVKFSYKPEWDIPTVMFYRPPRNDDQFLESLKQ